MITRVFDSYRSAFRGLPREVWCLAAVGVVNRMGAMVFPFLALYLTSQRDYSVAEAGVLLSTWAAGGMAGITLGGRLTDAIGPRPVMLASLTSNGLLLFLLGTVETRLGFACTAASVGLVAEAFRPATSAAIAAFSDEEQRVRAFALHRLAINVGWSIGPALGGVLAHVGYGWLFLVDGVTCVGAAATLQLLLPGGAWRGEAEERESAPEGPVASPWRDHTYLVVLALLLLQALAFFQIWSGMPLYLREQRGFDERLIGVLMAVNTVVIVVFEMVLVRAVERREPLRTMGVAGLLVAVGFGLLPWATTPLAVVGTILVWTLGEMLVAPVSVAWVSKRATAANRGRYMAGFGLTYSLGAILGPSLGAWTYEHVGPDALWYGCLALGVADLVGFWVLARRAPAN